MKNIYIVLSQTGTILSRLLKLITRAEYNHASISLHSDLHNMYSFGRVNAYNPFRGGFVMESPDFGTFKRFSQTRVAVLSIPVEDMVYDQLRSEFSVMYENRRNYGYDMLGLFLAYFHKVYHRDHRYYCSDYVRSILIKYDIADPRLFPAIVQPEHFLRIPDSEIVFSGKLREFSAA